MSITVYYFSNRTALSKLATILQGVILPQFTLGEIEIWVICTEGMR